MIFQSNNEWQSTTFTEKKKNIMYICSHKHTCFASKKYVYSQKSSEAAGCEASWWPAGCLRITAVILLSIFGAAIFQSFRPSLWASREVPSKGKASCGTRVPRGISWNDMLKQPGNERQKRACMNVYYLILFVSRTDFDIVNFSWLTLT